MSLFNNKPAEPQKNPEIEALKAELSSLKDEMKRANDELCSALYILDDEVRQLKDAEIRAPSKREMEDMKKGVDSLALIGRLCLQNKADIEVLSKKMELLADKKDEHKIKTPTKILN